jgi:hypothetical protein
LILKIKNILIEILRNFNTSGRSAKAVSKGPNIINEFLGFEDAKRESSKNQQ